MENAKPDSIDNPPQPGLPHGRSNGMWMFQPQPEQPPGGGPVPAAVGEEDIKKVADTPEPAE